MITNMSKKLCKASETAKILINKSLDRGYDIDIIKLQQLLTLIQGTMLARYNKIFFPEDIYCLEFTIIKEVHHDILSKQIILEKTNTDYVLSDEEKSIVDEILDRFGIYNHDTLKTTFVLSVLDKLYFNKEIIIPLDYLKIVFDEFGFGVTKEIKSNIGDKKTSNGTFVNFVSKYATLISNDFPKKWLPNPGSNYVPSEPDLGRLVDTIAENGFVEKYCLDKEQVKQLKLIRYYRKNYTNQD